MMNLRENLLFTDSSGPAFADSYTVTAYPVGAVATSSSSGSTLTVAAGHSFVAGDKILIGPGSANTFSGVNVVDSVSATSIVMDGGSYAVSVGDKIVNLGPDIGTASPNYDASPMGIYTDPAGSTAASNATVTASSAGEYSWLC